MHLPILRAPVYGDEGIHYWTARYLGGRLDAATSIWGHPRVVLPHLVLQRPLYYVAMWAPSQAGFAGFRLAASLWGAAMAPMAFALLRAHGVRLAACLAGGLAVATLPWLVVWGNLGLMDAPMTVLVLAMLWAHARGRWAATGILALAACWVKETAFLGVTALLLYELTRGIMVTLSPRVLLRERPAIAWLAGSLVLGLVPVTTWILLDSHLPGGPPVTGLAELAERMVVTPWLGAVVATGLALPRSRFLAGTALVAVGSFLALHAFGRGAPIWYDVPAQALTLVGAAATLDAWLATAWSGGRPQVMAAATTLAVAAAVLVAACGTLGGPDRAGLRPWGSDAGNPFPQAWEYEADLRDADFVHVVATVPDDAQAVLTFDVFSSMLVPVFLDRGPAVYVEDSSWSTRDFPPDTQAIAERVAADLARAIEMNGTWTLVQAHPFPLNEAVRAVYADCTVLVDGRFTLLDGSRCAGRVDDLVRATWPPTH